MVVKIIKNRMNWKYSRFTTIQSIFWGCMAIALGKAPQILFNNPQLFQLSFLHKNLDFFVVSRAPGASSTLAFFTLLMRLLETWLEMIASQPVGQAP